MYGYKQRTDGKCERTSCGAPSYSWSTRDHAKPATRTVVVIPTKSNRLTEPEAFFACATHAGAAKRKGGNTYEVYVVLDEVVTDRETVAKAEQARLQALWAEAAQARAEYVENSRGEVIAAFLAERDGSGYAKLDKADEYGRRYVVTSTYGHRMTPAEARSFAEKLLALADEATEAVS